MVVVIDSFHIWNVPLCACGGRFNNECSNQDNLFEVGCSYNVWLERINQPQIDTTCQLNNKTRNITLSLDILLLCIDSVKSDIYIKTYFIECGQLYFYNYEFVRVGNVSI